MSPEIIHSLILILCICFGFVFPKTSLAQYDLQIITILFIILFVGRKLINTNKSRLIESVIFTLVILFVINTTGELASPFFFLLYFLIFSLALLLEPIISVTTSLALILFFVITLPSTEPIQRLIPAFALAFLTPFALFMGKEYKEAQNSNIKVQKLETKLGTSKEDTYLFLSLMIKNHLQSMNQAIDNFIGDHELLTIRKHIRNIEHLIEKFENGGK
ncbi:hypothetical protein COY87_01405 [Candidatus Roizmanbacteria bacterium CG_4_10_14_0_8_um_filter_33_9]|uniref:Uncharacterized protein n=1 Tax=Candidatus Roizmanbacteria bacterium CG_4_10_14_0_8_um_filter_33_9 TaxID=1974826 RepID=A0A2M7QK78_9BACT|nr:MAG: hypothetical protein COY87_01405 [Candidatus Roizmanbacteria bacterium CG_4_10_14_0_8_um_filter_33_9]